MLQTTVNGKNSFSVDQADGQWQLNTVAADLDVQQQPGGYISVLYKGKSYKALVEKVDEVAKEITLRIDGQPYTVAIQEPIDQLLSSMGMDLKSLQKVEPVKAPVPGMILKVLVEPGQKIAKGDGLVILEAMKMENVLKAGSDGTVKAIRVQERTAVEKGAVLIELE